MRDESGPSVERRLEALEELAPAVEVMEREIGALARTVAAWERRGGLVPPADGSDAQALVDLGPASTDRGAPPLGGRTPTAWRGRTPAWRWRAWCDLEGWVRWLVWAYDLEGSDEGWARWWTSPGAVEHLVALREWHRELVDVEVAPLVPEGMSPAEGAAHDAAMRRDRMDRGRDWVYWHDALERAVMRVAGRDGGDLVGRHGDRGGDSATARRCEQLRREARDEFEAFLRGMAASGEASPPAPATASGLPPRRTPGGPPGVVPQEAVQSE